MCLFGTVSIPFTVNLTSNKYNPIRPVGTNVSLTCIVHLDPAVNVPVTVNSEWTRPDGLHFSPSYSIMENLTRYISILSISSFGRDQSGNYTCRVDIDISFLPFLDYSMSLVTAETIEVTVGKTPHIFSKI